MKFCRNLQRVIDITDPEWAPYWTNYKMLKKFLKALVPPEAAEPPVPGDAGSDASDQSSSVGNDGPGEGPREEKQASDDAALPSRACASVAPSSAAQMSRKPGEVAFFKLLNSELKKAIRFFDQAQLEMGIREARVREGIDIMRKANSLMVNEKWSLMAKSLYRLYKDLLLLETYAIMTYCSFSKILKKHDKVTKHTTRIAFMKNVVNKANFTHYPKLLEMITRCERLYDEVSRSLIAEGKSGLYEDERLFINMIHQLNEQALGTAETEGAPDLGGRKEQRRYPVDGGAGRTEERRSPESCRASISSQSQVNTLRSLVEENAINRRSKEGLARVAESDKAISATSDSAEPPPEQGPDDREGGKRPSDDPKAESQPSAKRAKSES